MSPRAAWRLESLGFRDVAHYVGGIADWTAAGMPIEGMRQHDLTAGALARTDVPTCTSGETLRHVRLRVTGSGWETCFVVNDRGIVLGRLYEKDLEGDPNAPASEAMQPGPVTYRPDFPADQLLDVMEQRELETAPVTRSDGTLVGLVRRADLDRLLSKARELARHRSSRG